MTTETQATGADTTQAGVQANAEGVTQGEGVATDAATTAATTTATTDPAKPEAEKPPAEYKFVMPEGVKLDEAKAGEFSAVAKELGLTQTAAQKLIDLYAKSEQGRLQQHDDLKQSWHDAVKADKDLGGDKLPESSAIARKAIDLGPPELKALLNDTGLGNHPVVFKWAHAVGKALSEDTFRAGAPAPQTGSMADRLYSSTPKT